MCLCLPHPGLSSDVLEIGSVSADWGLPTVGLCLISLFLRQHLSLSSEVTSLVTMGSQQVPDPPASVSVKSHLAHLSYGCGESKLRSSCLQSR